jgi:hypothetical protein
MGSHDKTIEKILARPPASDLKWIKMVSYLKSVGFTELKNSGSRRKFYSADKDVLLSLHEPHPSPDMDKGAVADVRDVLIAAGILKEK